MSEEKMEEQVPQKENKDKIPRPPSNPLEEKVWASLKKVMEPELGVPMVDLGLIYSVETNDKGHAYVRMTLTSPFCPMSGYMVQLVENATLETEGIKTAEVEVVFDPPWDPMTMATEEIREIMGYNNQMW